MHVFDAIKIVDFDPQDSDKIVHAFIQRCEDRGELSSWRICLSGFNDDPRELIEIPEAQKFTQRLIDLGILITLYVRSPQEDGRIIQKDSLGLDGFMIYAISRGIGKVKRKGKRVNIGVDIDTADYLTALLKTLKERNISPELIDRMEKTIAKHRKFDPLRGSTKFAFNEMRREEFI